tara:strand:+ start:9043 stop:9978 length:936 start_codon:yes stop_codon:yes gene_type:complete
MNDKIKYLHGVFGKSKLQNNGIELMVPCPYCKETKKMKMNIRLDSDLWHCWVCNSKGRSLGRLIKQKNPAKVAEYFERFAKNFTYNNYTQLQTTIEPVTIPIGFKLLMTNLNNPDALPIYQYAKSRGITDSMLWSFRVGFTEDWSYRRRLIIPSFTEEGELNYWTSRSIDPDNPYRYLNAKADKKQVIFNEIEIDWNKPVYLVEGPLDLIKCMNINSTCLLGSSLSEQSLLFYKLVMFADKIILCLDADAQKKQDAIAEALMAYDKRVYYVKPPSDGRDWGDLAPEEVESHMSQIIEYTKATRLNNLIGSL